MSIKEAIKAKGMTMAFIEIEAGIPARTLSQYNAGVKGLAAHHVKPLNKILKKYKINLAV